MKAAPKLPHAMPANDPPRAARYQTFEKIAEELGFTNTRAARNWCNRRGVPYHRDGGFNWVDRNLVEARIAAGPVHVVAKEPAPPTIDAWVSSTLTHGGRKHGT